MFLDTSALIEHFRGTPKGDRVREVLSREVCHASILTAAETADWCLANGLEPGAYLAALEEIVQLHPLDPALCARGARLKREIRRKASHFGLVDGLILAGARSLGEPLLTCDREFKGVEGVEVL